MLTIVCSIALIVVVFLALRELGLTVPQYIIASVISLFGLIFGWMGSALVFWGMVIYFAKDNKKEEEL